MYVVSADAVFTDINYLFKRELSSNRTVDSLVDVIIATSESVQRQHCEKPTSLPLVAAGGIPASTMLSGSP